jgi:hypothetical protein
LLTMQHGRAMQGRGALKQEDWKAAEKAFIDALWVDQTANAVNAVSWIGLCQVWRMQCLRMLPYPNHFLVPR